MADTVKASRLMLLGAVHRAVVTRIDFDEVDGLTLDPVLANAAGFLEHEKLEVHDVETGVRLACELRFGARDSGELVVTGAAATLVKPGDLVSLCAYGWMKARPAAKHQPRTVRVDDENRLVVPKKSKVS
jgi:aspartate 1-decarboxylase